MLKILSRGAPQGTVSAIGVALAAVAIAAGAPVRAAQTVYSTGFESPAYSAGPLAGQNGWFGAANAFVQTSTVESGSQAVSVAPGAAGQYVTFQPVSYNSVGNPNQLVTISTDFEFSPGPNVDWEALAAEGNGGFITQLLVTSSGQVCGFNPCNGPILTPDKWYNLSMTLNYKTGVVEDFVNGVEFSSGPFSNIPAHSTNLDLIGIGINGAAAGSTAGASWDNISVVSAAVPEPATWALTIVGLAMLGLAVRRRATTLAAIGA